MKKLLSLVSALFISLLVMAEPISTDQARLRVQSFLKTIGVEDNLSLRAADTPIYSSKSKMKGSVLTDYYYAFNIGEGEGFVIASGDDRAPSVLGYCESGCFKADDLPENMKTWLDGYAEQIAYIQKHDLNVSHRVVASGRSAVAPMIKTLWGQHSPFSDDCALDLPNANMHLNCVTGCVATAMAQIMNYYKYPTATVAEIPSYRITYRGSNGTEDVVDFPVIPANTTIDWRNMRDDYNGSNVTQRQKKAVAELMHYCGLSVQMRYNGVASGASSSNVAPALKNYFGYGPATRYVKRENFSWTEWDEMMYGEIFNHRPVFYSGSPSNGSSGHAFVVDGYQTNGYYHINWGWEGDSDGYFLLSLLSPDAKGTDGQDEGYNFKQDAVLTNLGGEDYKEDVRLTSSAIALTNGDSFTRTSANQSFSNVKFEWTVRSTLSDTYDMDIYYALYKGDEFVQFVGWETRLSEFMNTYSVTMTFSESFKDLVGNYRIVGISKEHGTEDWKVNNKSEDYFVTANITATTLKLTVNVPKEKEEIIDMEREALADFYREIRDQAQGIIDYGQVELQVPEHLDAIQTTIGDLSSQHGAIADSINAVSKKIEENDFPINQKQEYYYRLKELKEEYNTYNVNQLQKQATTTRNDYTSYVSTLNSIFNEADRQIANIKKITTTLDYELALSRAYDLKEKLGGYSFDGIISRLDKLDTDVEELQRNLGALTESLNKLSQEMDEYVPSNAICSFTLNCKRGYVGYNGSTLCGTIQSEASELAIIHYGETDYLYDVTHKAFLVHTIAATAGTEGNVILESTTNLSNAITGLTWGLTGYDNYPWYLEDCFGNWMNMDNKPQVYMNTWKEFSGGNGGNTYQVNIVNVDFDASEALEILDQFFNPQTFVTFRFTEPDGVVSQTEPQATMAETVVSEVPVELRKDYCTYELTPTTMVKGDNTVEVKVSYKLPFEASDDYENATWYYAKIGYDYYISIDDSEPYYPTTAKQEIENFQWAFMGTPHTGFVILNRSAGTKMRLTKVGDYVLMRESEERWELIAHDDGFNLLRCGSEVDYITLNGGNSGYLGLFVDTRGHDDTCGRWQLEEVPTGIKKVDDSKLKVENIATYDLQGRKLINGAVKSGLYIRNGQKVLVK